MGAIISFEGGDGSGKGTQSRLLYEYFQANEIPVKFESFPRYHTETGQKVAAYLNGELGLEVDAHEAGLLYSNDRLAAKDEMLDWLDQGGSWILDRYVDSNKGHQGGKLSTEIERLAFFEESDHIEFSVNGMPVPDKTILFALPPELAQTYVDQKMARKYTDKKRDIHEADPDHLRRANESFELFAQTYPERVVPINPVDETGMAMRSVEAIHADVVNAVRPLLVREGLIRF